jgi:hydrogenase maturation protein HypF
MQRRRWHLQGVVQGVGFRPFVHALALRWGLTGHVANDEAGVVIEAQGVEDALQGFIAQLLDKPPTRARITAVSAEELRPRVESTFVILPSVPGKGRWVLPTPDLGTCAACLAELCDPANRRHHYPFISCNDCGPRSTMQRDVPYDRRHTTMSAFQPCAACQAEYDDPANRRAHNQAICCPACGPRAWLEMPGQPPINGSEAIIAARQLLAVGGILAVKGIGGFHLACSAVQPAAVQRLRDRKGRGLKPFAVMSREVNPLRAWVCISEQEAALLEGPTRPILLLAVTETARPWFQTVAPGLKRLGCMLPYSPLHFLLMGDDPLVMTSGNRSEEPIAITNDQARTRLAPIADACLFHDRDIVLPCDDSVQQVVAGRVYTLRRARGLTPTPIPLAKSVPATLALGGDLKSAFCITRENEAFVSQHLGDWGAVESQPTFEKVLDHFLHILGVQPERVVADAHPAYLSAQWAQAWAQRQGVPLLRIQHHQAHVAALVTERSCDVAAPILGVCMDGTGFGTDGAIWGGEFLLVSSTGWRRLAHLKYVPLPGGDAAIRRPRRVALAHLWAANLEWNPALPCVQTTSPAELRWLAKMLPQPAGSVPTSSMGRLFDAVAALLGIRQEVNYEAQAAMELEALADATVKEAEAAFGLLDTTPLQLDPGPVLRSLMAGQLAGEPKPHAAGRFHQAVADAILAVAERARTAAGIRTVALTGGVFQNALLVERVVEGLRAAGFDVLQHSSVPCHDGGLALGQAALANGLIPAEWVSA